MTYELGDYTVVTKRMKNGFDIYWFACDIYYKDVLFAQRNNILEEKEAYVLSWATHEIDFHKNTLEALTEMARNELRSH